MQSDGSLDLRVPGKGIGVVEEQEEEKEEEKEGHGLVKRQQRVFLKLRTTLPVGSQLNHFGTACSCCLHSKGHLCRSCNDRLKATTALSAVCPFSKLDHF